MPQLVTRTSAAVKAAGPPRIPENAQARSTGVSCAGSTHCVGTETCRSEVAAEASPTPTRLSWCGISAPAPASARTAALGLCAGCWRPVVSLRDTSPDQTVLSNFGSSAVASTLRLLPSLAPQKIAAGAP